LKIEKTINLTNVSHHNKKSYQQQPFFLLFFAGIFVNFTG